MIAVREGNVEYGARAFEQDASQAIRGDIIRALIELITNSDDAYAGAPGQIVVRVSKSMDTEFPVMIQVQDQAVGLDAEGLIRNFSILGGQKISEERHEHARGLLGRGAKDVASLGLIRFEAIKNGNYSRMTLTSTGQWKLDAENVPATEGNRIVLGLDLEQNGLMATVYVQRHIRVMSKAQLQEKLSHHAQLRDLIARRQVRLQDERDGMFTAILESREARGEVVIDKDLSLNGYDKPVHIVIRRFPSKVPGSLNEYSEHGLLVRSGPTVFENTWFNLDGRPEVNFFAGEITAPEVGEIIRAFDEGDREYGGATRLLARDRDGLVATHPYRKELARAVTAEVKPLLDSLATQMDAGRKQGEELSRAFKVAGAALREQLNEILQEIEETIPSGGEGSDEVFDLVVVPPRRLALPGAKLSFHVRARDLPDAPAIVSVEDSSNNDVISSVAPSAEPWQPHGRLEAFQTLVFATAGLDEGTATLRVQVGDHIAKAQIIVQAPDEQDDVTPIELELQPSSARVAPTRGKRLLVRAPLDLADQALEVGYTGVDLFEVPTSVVLRTEPGGRWVTAVVRLQAGNEKGQGVVTVRAANQASTQANILVDETAGRGGLDLDFELTAQKSPTRRIELRTAEGSIRLRIYGLHPTFAGVFGSYDVVQENWTKENSPEARAVLAEVVASELAGHLTEVDYNKHPERYNDAPRVLKRRAEIANRFLTTMHRALKPQE